MSKDISWSMTPIEEHEIPVEISFFLDNYIDVELLSIFIKTLTDFPTDYDAETLPELIQWEGLIDDYFITGIPGEKGMILFIDDRGNDEKSVKISKESFLLALNKKKEELENKAK